MDSKTLVNGFDAELGRKAVEAFDKGGLEVKAALWFYFSDAQEWRLLVATPLYDAEGPLKAYTRVSEVLAQESLADDLPLSRVAVVSPQQPQIALLRSAVSIGPKIDGIRFQRNVINGVLIEDAFIYKLQ